MQRTMFVNTHGCGFARRVSFALAVCCLAIVVHADAAPSLAGDAAEKIEEIRNGTRTEARASWWGFDADDSTAALQAAMDSGAKRLIVEKMPSPWIVEPLQIRRDNLAIVLEEGAVIEAKRGSFKSTKDALLSIVDGQHIVIRGLGQGATLRMHRDDYMAKGYKKGEHRHCINLRSSKHIRLENLTLSDSGGDGIYIGTHNSREPCEDITIREVLCDRNHRQGISVISVDGLRIENSILRNTCGTPPLSGIDFEPNHAYQVLKNIVMRNCVMENNKGAGAVIYSKLNADSEPISIRFERCLLKNNPFAITMVNAIDAQDIVGGNVVVDTCVLDGGDRNAMILGNKPAVGVSLTVRNTVLQTSKPGVSPIVVRASADSALPLGGARFENCVVNTPADTPPIHFDDQHGFQRIEGLTGALSVRGSGLPTLLPLSETYLASLAPDHNRFPIYPIRGRRFEPFGELAAIQNNTFPYGLKPFSVRHAGMLAVYAEAGDEVRLRLTHGQAGWRKSDTAELFAYSPAGKKLPLGRLPFKKTRTLTWTAPETGVYRIPFTVDNGGVFRAVQCNRPVLWATPGSMYLHLFRYGSQPTDSSTGDLYFYVPEGTTEFGLLLAPRSREWLGATVYDPDGKELWSKDTIKETEQVVLKPRPGQTARPWKINIRPPAEGHMEDAYLLLQNVPPFVATRPGDLLVPVEAR